MFAVLWFGPLDYRTLIKSDEGRYAEIAREMTVSGDWVTPRYNDVKYFYKPPLQYWATATAYEVFGINEWTARLWVGLTSFASVLVLFFAGRQLFGGRAALLGAVALASMVLPAFAGHFNTLDMGVGSFMCAALFAILLAQRDEASLAQERFWMLVCWAMMALALLSKGLMGIVLPGLVLFVYIVWTRDFARLKRLHIIKGLALFLLIGAPWFVLVMRANPEFFQFFFIHEHFERFPTEVHARYQPAWYFIPFLLLGALPWTLYLGSALLHGLGRDASASGLAGDRSLRSDKGLRPWRPRLLLMLWVVVIFVFFSASKSKLAGYIVPIFPALAMLLGLALADSSRRLWQLNAGLIALLGVAGLIATFWIPGLADTPGELAALQHYQRWAQAAAVVIVIAALVALAWPGPRYQGAPAAPLGAALCLALGSYLATQAMMLGHESMRDQGASSYGLAKALTGHLASRHPDKPYDLYLVDDFDHTLLFYARKTAFMVHDRDELDFGLNYSPDRYIPDIKTFTQRWEASPVAAAVMYHKTLETLRAAGLKHEVVARDSLRVAIVKPAP